MCAIAYNQQTGHPMLWVRGAFFSFFPSAACLLKKVSCMSFSEEKLVPGIMDLTDIVLKLGQVSASAENADDSRTVHRTMLILFGDSPSTPQVRVWGVLIMICPDDVARPDTALRSVRARRS